MKIYKITEASEYLGVSINTLKTLANKVQMTKFGWECPKCGSVWAPHFERCDCTLPCPASQEKMKAMQNQYVARMGEQAIKELQNASLLMNPLPAPVREQYQQERWGGKVVTKISPLHYHYVKDETK